MFYPERFAYENGRRLVNEFAEGAVQIFMHETGMRWTEIDVAGKTVTVARRAIPGYIPNPRIPKAELADIRADLDEYGEIDVRGERLVIKRFHEDVPQFIVKDGPTFIGQAVGNRLVLAIAYSLGVSDEEMLKDLHGSSVDTQVVDRIATVIFQS